MTMTGLDVLDATIHKINNYLKDNVRIGLGKSA
jgi:hypothetical protein